jgi:hypothetical protein
LPTINRRGTKAERARKSCPHTGLVERGNSAYTEMSLQIVGAINRGELSMKRVFIVITVTMLLAGTACNMLPVDSGGEEAAVEQTARTLGEADPAQSLPSGEGVEISAAQVDVAAPASDPGALIYPENLAYLGAFRLPDDAPDEIGWWWSGGALTYYPGGDPGGPDDGHPGSLFGTGHDWNTYVSEISIPQPIISPSKNPNELNTAGTLQPFQDIKGGLVGSLEIPRVGLAYLPPQGAQASGKLYFAWAQHMGEGESNPSHGWAELDLANPQSAGLWRIGDYWNFVTGDYLFAIPPEWADTYAPGMYLATGRYRDGGQGAQGPSILAVAPWNAGNPPAAGSTLPAIPLLMYGNVYTEGSATMIDYHHSDEWNGAAWLTAGGKSAVIFAGTKGLGENWYGCSDGTVWEPPYPEGGCPDHDRGWWSTAFEARIIFYDPADLAAVALGNLEAWQPQPYSVMVIDDVLYHLEHEQQKSRVGAAAFDRERGLLYVLELFGDGDKPLVHVWRVSG